MQIECATGTKGALAAAGGTYCACGMGAKGVAAAAALQHCALNAHLHAPTWMHGYERAHMPWPLFALAV